MLRWLPISMQTMGRVESMPYSAPEAPGTLGTGAQGQWQHVNEEQPRLGGSGAAYRREASHKVTKAPRAFLFPLSVLPSLFHLTDSHQWNAEWWSRNRCWREKTLWLFLTLLSGRRFIEPKRLVLVSQPVYLGSVRTWSGWRSHALTTSPPVTSQYLTLAS